MLVRTLTRTHATQNPTFGNSLFNLRRIRNHLAESDFVQSLNAYLVLLAFAARNVEDYFSYYYAQMFFFPAAFVSTFTSAILSWSKLYFEYQIQKSMRLPTLGKAIVDTLIFAATGTAVLGGMLAAGVFSSVITPVLIFSSCALKSVWDFASAAGHFYKSFNTLLTPCERQAHRNATYKNLWSGLSNLLVVAALGLLQFTGVLYVYPLVIGLAATAIGISAALIKKTESKKIEVVKSVSSSVATINALGITRSDVLYGLEKRKLKTELPSVYQIAVSPRLLPVVPIAVAAAQPNVAANAPVADPAEGQQQVDGALRLI